MKKIAAWMPGMFLCLLIALPAWLLGRAVPVIGGAVFAIVMGILLGNCFPKLADPSFRLTEGIRFTAKKILQASVVLLGFEMNLYHIVKVGGQSLSVMLFTLSAAFIAAFFLGRLLKLPGNTTVLIGVGTSICGGSAIAATAPVIRAKEEEVAHAISTIFLFNILAVFLFPALGHLMGLSDGGFGIWAGTAINDTSSVVAAGAAWSAVAGNDIALQIATIVKLTRTLMIIPITLALAIFTARRKNQGDGGDFSLRQVFPWFVLLFLAAAVVSTFALLPPALPAGLAAAGKFMIVMAMVAIGLGTKIKDLLSHGVKPILLGLSCWACVALVSLLVQRLLHIV